MKSIKNIFINEQGWPQVHGEKLSVEFTIQSGPIKEFGVEAIQKIQPENEYINRRNRLLFSGIGFGCSFLL